MKWMKPAAIISGPKRLAGRCRQASTPQRTYESVIAEVRTASTSGSPSSTPTPCPTIARGNEGAAAAHPAMPIVQERSVPGSVRALRSSKSAAIAVAAILCPLLGPAVLMEPLRRARQAISERRKGTLWQRAYARNPKETSTRTDRDLYRHFAGERSQAEERGRVAEPRALDCGRGGDVRENALVEARADGLEERLIPGQRDTAADPEGAGVPGCDECGRREGDRLQRLVEDPAGPRVTLGLLQERDGRRRR